LCPPAPGVGRFATRDVDVDGHVVPEGYTVLVPIYALHRDPELWRDPLRFDPERFAPERMRDIDRWQYLPFGAGPRSCIGDHFAMLEATLAVATIVRAARLSSLRADFPTTLAATLTAAEPIPVRVTRRV
jgi:cytochrome P450